MIRARCLLFMLNTFVLSEIPADYKIYLIIQILTSK